MIRRGPLVGVRDVDVQGNGRLEAVKELTVEREGQARAFEAVENVQQHSLLSGRECVEPQHLGVDPKEQSSKRVSSWKLGTALP